MNSKQAKKIRDGIRAVANLNRLKQYTGHFFAMDRMGEDEFKAIADIGEDLEELLYYQDALEEERDVAVGKVERLEIALSEAEEEIKKLKNA